MISTHESARAVLRGALPGAQLTFQLPARRQLYDPARWLRRGFWQAYVPRGGATIAGTYELPCDPRSLVAAAQARADQLVRARALGADTDALMEHL